VLIFKVLVPQALYNLSDEAMEYQLRDRLSFRRSAALVKTGARRAPHR
jgi:IS5 family transposase